MEYKAISLDLDGTLTNSQKKVSDKNKETIFKALDKGIKVILASGRPLFGITSVADILELSKRGGYILAYNGGNIVDCTNGELIYSRFVPDECVHDICCEAQKNNVYAITYYKDYVLAESDEDEYVKKEAFCNGAEIKKVENLEQFFCVWCTNADGTCRRTNTKFLLSGKISLKIGGRALQFVYRDDKI